MASLDAGHATVPDQNAGCLGNEYLDALLEDLRRSAEGNKMSRLTLKAKPVEIDGVAHEVEDDDAVIVPAGARHNVINTGDEPLRFYTLYGPPEHQDGVVQSTKAEAEARHEDEQFDGKTTE